MDFAKSNTDSSSLCATQWITMIAGKSFCKSALTPDVAPIMTEAPSKFAPIREAPNFPS